MAPLKGGIMAAPAGTDRRDTVMTYRRTPEAITRGTTWGITRGTHTLQAAAWPA
jgi:hypothetical protein